MKKYRKKVKKRQVRGRRLIGRRARALWPCCTITRGTGAQGGPRAEAGQQRRGQCKEKGWHQGGQWKRQPCTRQGVFFFKYRTTTGIAMSLFFLAPHTHTRTHTHTHTYAGGSVAPRRRTCSALPGVEPSSPELSAGALRLPTSIAGKYVPVAAALAGAAPLSAKRSMSSPNVCSVCVSVCECVCVWERERVRG